MSTKLVGDKVYFPSSGINLDSNGIIIRPDEAIDGVNINITGSEIRPRFGTMALDPFVDTAKFPDHIIHYHEFLEPAGITNLFAFTNRSIYKYTVGEGWTSILAANIVGGNRFDQWSTTDFVDLVYGSTVVAVGSNYTAPDVAESQGTNRVILFYNRTSGEFEVLEINSNFPITEEDLEVTAPSALLSYSYISYILFTVKHYDKWQDAADPDYRDFTIDIINSPAGPTSPVIVTFMYKDAEKTELTIEIDEAIAAAITITGKLSAMTTQTIVDAINMNAEASNIVTASNGSNATPEETGTPQNIAKSVSGLVSGVLDNNVTTSLSFVKVTPGLFSIKTEQGTLALCGSEVHTINGKEAYRLLPVDSRYTAYGDKSYVYLDGTGWQLSFTTHIYGGLDLYADYYYERRRNYFPKVVQVFRNALMFANTYEDDFYYPWRVRWTQPGDMTITNDDWFTDLVVSDTSGIRTMRTMGTESFTTLGTYLYVYKDKSVARGGYNQQTFIDFDTAFKEGVYAVRTIQDVEGMQFFLGTNDIYMFNGIQRKSLTFDPEMKSTRIREWMNDLLDPITLKNTFAVYDKYRRKYILFIKQRGEEFPTNALVYDIDRSFWVRYVFPPTSAAIHLSMSISFNTIDSLVGNIDNLLGTIDELGGSTTNQVTIYAMTKDSYLALNSAIHDKVWPFYNEATPKTHTLITRDFLFNSLEEAERISLMKFEAYGTAINVRYSTEYATKLSNFTAIPNHENFTLSGGYKTYFYNCDTQADKIRFAFTSTQDFKLRWMQVFSIQTTEITEE